MSAPILQASGDGREEAIGRAATALRAGRAVVIPTDTVYGVAADAFNPAGTARVFAAKRRARSLPLPVLVRSPKQLLGLTPQVSEAAEWLMAAFWPGPLTLVLPTEVGLRWDLGDNDATVAVRMPLDDVALEVIRAVGPLAVTSANRSGGVAATTASQAAQALGEDVDLVVDDGPRATVSPSTIVDLTRSTPRVLRSGAIDEGLVLGVAQGSLPPIEAAAIFEGDAADAEPPRSSGAGSDASDAPRSDASDSEDADEAPR